MQLLRRVSYESASKTARQARRVSEKNMGSMRVVSARLRRPQFRLATLFILVTAICVFLGIRVSRERAYRQRLAAVQVLDAAPFAFSSIYVAPPDDGGELLIGIDKEALEPGDAVTTIDFNPMRDGALTDEQTAAILCFPTLKELRLGGPGITEARLAKIAELPCLEYLDISDADVNDDTVRPLVELRSLRTLGLDGTDISDVALKRLSGLHELRHLGLVNTRITDAGLRHISAFRSLRALHLSGTRISGSGLKHLSDLAYLEVLGLEDTDVDDEGLHHLARLPRLRELALSPHISDEGLEVLRRCDRLNQLVVRKCAISDDGLWRLRNITTLRQVFAEHATSITADGAARLSGVRAGFDIYWKD
ncbi:MAG TPA: hypothetical protein VHC22_17075 [Pirellulales bacterium]|nr:hypothetical protein [Pirellulales bacterium]